MAFKMAGFSAFTKTTDYKPQSVVDPKDIPPPSVKKDKASERSRGDITPQTELNKMDLEGLVLERERIFNNDYEDAKADDNTSTIKLLEGRMDKLDKLIDKKRQDMQTGNYDEVD